MDAALSGILDESREYYLGRKRSLAGAILGIPRGTVKFKKSERKDRCYCYLHARSGQSFDDIYLGKTDAVFSEKLQELFARKKKLLAEMAVARKSLRLLRVKSMIIDHEDFISPIREVFQEFDKLGLWESGLELVESWCFKVYQNHLGVEPYPLRTLDVDIAIPVPYKGHEVDLGGLLKNVGFEADFRPNGAVFYVGFGMIIDLISPEKGRGTKDGKVHIAKLGVSTLALRDLNVLLENPAILHIRGVGKLSIPSMPAFLIHKLLIAPLRPDDGKRTKDYRQVHAIAKRIFTDDKLIRELATIFWSIPAKWSARVRQSAQAAHEYLPEDQQADLVSILLTRAADLHTL